MNIHQLLKVLAAKCKSFEMKSLTSTQQVKFGAVLSYVGIAVYVLIGLLYTPWMIRTIGKDDYGLYTLAYSITSLFVFDFGLSVAIQRFVAKYLAEKCIAKVNNFLSLACRLYIYIDIALLVILTLVFFLIPLLYAELSAIQIDRLKIVFLITSLFSVISFPFIPLNGILSAYEKFVQLKGCDLLSKVLTVLINIICLSLGGGLYELVLTNAIVGFFIISLKYIVVKKTTDVSIRLTISDNEEMKNLLTFTGWTTVVAICQRCIFNIAPSIMGIFEGADAIAVLGIAITLEAYTFAFAFAINGLFLPKISRILNDDGSVLPLMISVGRFQILAMGLILVAFLILGQDFLHLWVGNGFEDSYLCTILFIVPAFFFLPANIADQTLIASGKVKYQAYIYIIMACTNIPLSLILTNYWGIVGLAVAIFVSYMFRNILSYYAYYKLLKINIFSFLKDSFGKMFPGLLLSGLLSYFICRYIDAENWMILIAEIVIVAFCYIVCMLFISMNKSEKSMILRALRKSLYR